ncbi:TetR family transcriptional regulator OS=Streptomyces antimycoticus OX=68175 GN=SANT12839_087550 PE=4 SV=1 [Streptomyces antimycoticus]
MRGFSVAEAARRTCVSPGAPYRHFADRDALLVAAALEVSRRLRPSTWRPRPRPAWLERLATVAGGLPFARPPATAAGWTSCSPRGCGPPIRSYGHSTRAFDLLLPSASR